MKISLIAAIGKNRELGQGNKLIWHISSDLKRFKELTMGHPIVMGRKTYESIGRVLPGRTNIIITQNSKFKTQNCLIANSIEQAIDFAKKAPGSDEIFIIGGAQIFSQTIKFADKLYLTIVDAEDKNADVFFPDYSEFQKVIFQEKREENGLRFQCIDLERE